MLTMTAVLSAIAVVLAFFKFHAPLSPSFVRMDLSDLPASVIMGIVAAIVNCFILFPAFEAFMSLEQLIASFGGLIPAMQTRNYLQYIAEEIHSAVLPPWTGWGVRSLSPLIARGNR